MRRRLKIVAWIVAVTLALPFVSFGVYDLIYFQPRSAEISHLLQSATSEESDPSPALVKLVEVSTNDHLDWLVARILFEKLNVMYRPSNRLGWHLTSALWRQLVRFHLTDREQRTLYLAHIYMGIRDGEEIRGFSASSQEVFHKPLSTLNLNEAATIAAIPWAPSHATRDPKWLAKRRDYLLSKLENGS